MASHTNPSMPAAFRLSLILIAGLALLVIATCGKDSPTKPTPPQPPTPPPAQPVPTRIMITPATTTLTSIGQTVQLSATVLGQNGQPVPGAVVTWSSGNAAVATVNSQGLVTAVMNGTAQITARAGNASASVNVTVTDTSRDRDALIALYHATNGPDWSSKSNWLSDLPLGDWFGVTTNAQGEVTRLELPLNNVQGSIPAEIGQLKNLISLSFSGNHLSGHIPPEIGQIKNLRVLRLWNNRLTGGIPPEIGQLRNLTVLTLGRNQLAGTLPAELGQLENLLDFRLDENTELSGPLPTEFTRMTQLRRLRLNGTETCIPPTTPFHQWLSGIPAKSISAYCTSPERDALIALYRRTNGRNWTNSTNWTSYTSPGDWFGVTTDADGKVTKLVLPDNNMSGLLPGQLSDLTRLEVLNLSSNSGLSANIPRSFTSLDLSEFDLGGTQVCAPFDDQFREWLDAIPHQNITYCTETRPDYYPMAALYHSSNGPNWNNNTNWLSEAPLHSWQGVKTNSSGQVTSLDLSRNNLQGEIPSDIGQLDQLTYLNLAGNSLAEPIPPEIGQLHKLTTLDLSRNQLTGDVPSEIGDLQELRYLGLGSNQLTGSIPSEIGQLHELRNLHLSDNRLTGDIPPEIWELQNLWGLFLRGDDYSRDSGNRLTGAIPPEIARMENLEILSLESNQLTGNIPSEIGELTELRDLRLTGNQFTGTIPSEIGQLHKLTTLALSDNQLTGDIPPEMGQLLNLQSLDLSRNGLEGTIPAEIGAFKDLIQLTLSNNQLTGTLPSEFAGLGMLEVLQLSFNRLSGSIPDSFGDLSNLKLLGLTGNANMSGALHLSLINLALDDLLLGGTMLCAPQTAEFQDWLLRVPNRRVPRCETNTVRSAAYLTQAVQSLEYLVPLVSEEDALLRVFVTSESDMDAHMPPVRATFYNGGAEVHTVDIPSQETPIPTRVDEGDLSSSANARIPGWVLTPGLEMVIEIDPEGVLDPAFGIKGRLPAEGRTAVNVREVPPFDLTMVPFLWTENPDRSILEQVEGLTADSDLLRLTRDILPVGELNLTVREPVWTSVEPVWAKGGIILRETYAIRTMDGTGGHWMGILLDRGGKAFIRGTTSVSALVNSTIAHELGHNISLGHAPCGGGLTSVDPDFPYPDGNIGAWGYDLLNEKLVHPQSREFMGCGSPLWISDFFFTKAMSYRFFKESEKLLGAAFEPSGRNLLLWGGVNSDGDLVLEPSFVVDAPTSLPDLNGPYLLTGKDDGGGTLFSLRFGMAEIACGEGEGGAFSFIIPVRAAWSNRLTEITLSGPEGVATLGSDMGLDGQDAPAAALLLDSVTGNVRGILRDWPEPGITGVAARRMLPEPGLDAVISSGVPDAVDWNR